MPKLSAEDVLFTAGALILGLWAYRTINTFVSYAVETDEKVYEDVLAELNKHGTPTDAQVRSAVRRRLLGNATTSSNTPGFSESFDPSDKDAPTLSPPVNPLMSSNTPTEKDSYERIRGPYKYLPQPTEAQKKAARLKRMTTLREYGQKGGKSPEWKQNPIQQLGQYIGQRVQSLFVPVIPPMASPIMPPITVAPLVVGYARAYSSEGFGDEFYGYATETLPRLGGTRLSSEDTPEGGYMTAERCARIESKNCCQQAADAQGLVTEEAMKNCHLCNHPDCTDVTAQQDDPAIALPFKKGIVGVIKPKGSDIYNYVYDPSQNLEDLKKAQYARAYAANESIGIDCSTGFKVKPGPNRVARQKWHDDQCKDAYIAGGSGIRLIKPRNDWDPLHPSFHPPLPGRTRELNRTQFPEDGELEYPLGYGEPGIQLSDETGDASISQTFKDQTTNAYARAYNGRVTYY